MEVRCRHERNPCETLVAADQICTAMPQTKSFKARPSWRSEISPHVTCLVGVAKHISAWRLHYRTCNFAICTSWTEFCDHVGSTHPARECSPERALRSENNRLCISLFPTNIQRETYCIYCRSGSWHISRLILHPTSETVETKTAERYVVVLLA